MKAFPEPSNSPAHYARTLSLVQPSTLTAVELYAHPWVHSFRHIVELRVTTQLGGDRHATLVQLHQLSPTLKSLSLEFAVIPLSEILDLTCSFPLLEDLGLELNFDNDDTVADGWDAPSTSPKLIGCLSLNGEVVSFIRQLLGLPNGLHCTKIDMTCRVKDAELTGDLVLKCSNTLESLSIEYYAHGSHLTPAPFDLSRATQLKNVEFHWETDYVQWITITLRTVEPGNLQQIHITIDPEISLFDLLEETINQQWRDLDRLLAQLWTSYSIRPEVMLLGDEDEFLEVATRVMPELRERGAFDHPYYFYGWGV